MYKSYIFTEDMKTEICIATFIVEPVGDLLVDFIQDAYGHGQQYFRQELEDSRELFGFDLSVHPVLHVQTQTSRFANKLRTSSVYCSNPRVLIKILVGLWNL